MTVNVPNVAGVPPVNFTPGQVPPTLLTQDARGSFAGVAQRWGVFLNGVNVITADSVVSIDYKQEWQISDYPIEEGAFASYDKVQIPFDARVRFMSGGTEANRAKLLTSIAAIAGDLNFYSVATPEKVYSNCNIQHYDYRRAATNGLGLIQVDVWLQEIRQVSSSGSTGGVQNAQQPTSNDASHTGSVQPESIQQSLAATSGFSVLPTNNPVSIAPTLGATSGYAVQ